LTEGRKAMKGAAKIKAAIRNKRGYFVIESNIFFIRIEFMQLKTVGYQIAAEKPIPQFGVLRLIL
jgi:hypothetical protein